MATKIAIGTNNTSGLAALTPQPAVTPGTFAQVDAALSGAIALQGEYRAFVYADTIAENDWFSVLAQCGLSLKNKVYFKAVTVQLVNDEDSSTFNYNATARYLGDGARNYRMWKTTVWIVNMVAF